MDEPKIQKIRKIAEEAFKHHFGNVEIVRINVKPGLGIDDDPIVDINIIYKGKYEQLNPAGLLRVKDEVHSGLDADADLEQDAGWPLLHFISKSDIGRRDPATV